MTVEYVDNVDRLTAEQLAGYFAGWPTHPDLARHLEILRGSAKVWLAMDGARCVGFVNAISDGGFAAFVPLLEVRPEYRGRGIGAELVRRMLASLDGHYSIDVVCDDDVVGFYERLGFTRLAGMARRDRAHQRGE